MAKAEKSAQEHSSSWRRDLLFILLAFLAAVGVGAGFLFWGSKTAGLTVLVIPVAFIIIATIISRTT